MEYNEYFEEKEACIYCGTLLDEDDDICPVCGTVREKR